MKIIEKHSIFQTDVANVNIYIPNNRASNTRKKNKQAIKNNRKLPAGNTYEYRQKLYLKN